jgi:hypothetical protein
MIVPFMDGNTGTAVYINPDYIVTLRPDPVDLDRISVVKLEDREHHTGARRAPGGR